MLDLAVKARIPLINIQTEDVMFLDDLFFSVLGFKPKKATPEDLTPSTNSTGGVFYMSETSSQGLKDLVTTHKGLKKTGSTLILVNRLKPHPTIFEVGPVMPSKEHIKKYLMDAINDEKMADDLMSVLGGCGIKATSDYITLTMARDHTLSNNGVTKTRRQFFQGQKGLQQVDLHQPFYLPGHEISQWSLEEKDYFLHASDPRLRARGILMKGLPGVGKTEGAKWLARQWGVPLFRLDLASTKDKYVGESQRFLDLALAQVSREEPCMVLIDEVEKVASSKQNDSSGTSSDMLSQLLWWLAEHRSRVLTIMTCNDVTKVPPELIRPGRIDKNMLMRGLSEEDVGMFTVNLLETFGIDLPEDEETEFLKQVAKDSFLLVKPGEDEVAHATVRRVVISQLKANYDVTKFNGEA